MADILNQVISNISPYSVELKAKISRVANGKAGRVAFISDDEWKELDSIHNLWDNEGGWFMYTGKKGRVQVVVQRRKSDERLVIFVL